MMTGSQSLDPRAARSRPYELSGKEKAITAAKEMQAIVDREVKKSGITDPQYEFQELIGKGAFGRVYKSKHVPSNRVVAIKIIDIDAADYSSKGEDTAKDVLRETGALRALKESNAKNINVIYDAFFLASYVWIVSEYCPGGSVHTLMRASPEPGLSETYIIPIAREVAEALKWVHSAGIIHRDVKAANILISEDGRVQLCDFGVAGVLESKINKRTTILGTPHYMAPEMLDVIESNRIIHYGNEIDIWAFGCTLYELATGLPPNARVSHEHLRFVVRDQAPRLEGTKYSAGLREFVAFCIEESPSRRPSIEQVQNHYYILNTARRYPTGSLKRLLYDYYMWERSGGQRASLFMPGGAPVPELSKEQHEDEWNFSTTEIFDKSFAEDQTSQQTGLLASTSIHDLQPDGQGHQTAQLNESHRRIPLKPLERLFIADDTYNYLERGQQAQNMSDLPLREQNENSSRRETVIDAGAFDPSTGIATIPDLSTVRGNKKFGRFLRDSDDESETVKFQESEEGAGRRATKDWKFPTLAVSAEESEARRKTQDWKFPTMVPTDEPTSAFKITDSRPALVHSVTEPIGSSFEAEPSHEDPGLTISAHSIIDLDDYAASPIYAGPGPDIVTYDQSAFEPFGIDPDSTVYGPSSHQLSGSEDVTVDAIQGGLSSFTGHLGEPTVQNSAIPEVFLSTEDGNNAKSPDFEQELDHEEQLKHATDEFGEQQEQAWDDHQPLNPHALTTEYSDVSQNQDWTNYPTSNDEHRGFDEPRPSRYRQNRWDSTEFPTMHGGEGSLHPTNDPFDDPPAYVLPNRYRLEHSPGPATARRVGRMASVSSEEDKIGHEEEYHEHGYGSNPFQLGPASAPPSAAALAEGAPPEVLQGELERMLNDFMGTLGTIRRGLETNLSRDQRRAAAKGAAKLVKKAKKAADKKMREEKVAEAAEKEKEKENEKAKVAELEKDSKEKDTVEDQEEKAVAGAESGGAVGATEAAVEGESNDGGQAEVQSGEE